MKERIRGYVERSLESDKTNKDVQDIWRSNTTQLRVHLGVQEQSALNWTLRPYTESDFYVPHMVGNIISYSFQWHQAHNQMMPESTEIVKSSGRPESISVLRRRLLGCWPIYHIGAHLGCVQRSCTSLNTLYSIETPKLGFGFCLD
jgi:hypothetical protein